MLVNSTLILFIHQVMYQVCHVQYKQANLARSTASFFLVSVAVLSALMFFIISNFERAKGSLYDGVLLLRLNC